MGKSQSQTQHELRQAQSGPKVFRKHHFYLSTIQINNFSIDTITIRTLWAKLPESDIRTNSISMDWCKLVNSWRRWLVRKRWPCLHRRVCIWPTSIAEVKCLLWCRVVAPWSRIERRRQLVSIHLIIGPLHLIGLQTLRPLHHHVGMLSLTWSCNHHRKWSRRPVLLHRHRSVRFCITTSSQTCQFSTRHRVHSTKDI